MPLVVGCEALLAGRMRIPVAGDGSCGAGWIQPAGHARPIDISEICASLAEPGPAPAAADDFARCEAVALAAFLRQSRPRPLNPPRAGGVCAFVLSLPEQWALCGRACLLHPMWRPFDPATPPGPAEVVVRRLFDPSLRRADDEPESAEDAPAVVAGRPAGALVSCGFVGETLSVVRGGPGGPAPVRLPDPAARELRDLVARVRGAFGLDFGEVVFSYLGRPEVWSVSPFFPQHHGAHGDGLVAALAGRLAP